MLNVIEVYNDVEFRINQAENGNFSYAKFNAVSWLAQLNLIDWLTGSLSGVEPPEPYLSQKNIDWVSDFIKEHKASAVDGRITRPSDFYLYQDLYKINGKKQSDCEEDDEENDITQEDLPNTPITHLSLDKFNWRGKTYIKDLRPSHKSPIAKTFKKSYEFNPKDIGSVCLEYIAYPQRAEIKVKIDDEFNNEVPDPDTSINFEWGEYARGLLVWFICDEYFNNTRENAGKQLNAATGKTPRG